MSISHSLSVGIVADDLTSAADAAAPFCAKGYAPLIRREIGGTGEAGPVVAIDANSRSMRAPEAEKASASAAMAARDRGLLLKTIDSTLRGHVREEIAAVLRASGRQRLVIAPAFPAAGRHTVHGTQLVDGIPVHESAYGRDPVHPARTADIRDLVDGCLGEPFILAEDPANRSIELARKAGVLILDATSQDALNRQVARISDPGSILWVGSPGLAIALAEKMPCGAGAASPPDFPVEHLLIVAGSANPVSQAQCEALAAGGVPVVCSADRIPDGAQISCLRAPEMPCADPASVLAVLAGETARALARSRCNAIIATGGETMAAVLDRIGVSRFRLTGEVEPGFPLGMARRADGTSFVIGMKAGGFGTANTLLRAAQRLLTGKAVHDAGL